MPSIKHRINDPSWKVATDAFDITADGCGIGTTIGLKNNVSNIIDANNPLGVGTALQVILDCDSFTRKNLDFHSEKPPFKMAHGLTPYFTHFIDNTSNLKYIDVDHLFPIKLSDKAYEWEMTSIPIPRLETTKTDSNTQQSDSEDLQTAIAELPIDKTTDWTSSLSSMIKAVQLSLLYKAEEEEYGDYVKGFELVALVKAQVAIDLISNLAYKNISLELTPDCSIIFNIHRSNDIKIFVELYFDPSEGESKEAYFAFYVGHDCIRNGMGTLENVIEDVRAL